MVVAREAAGLLKRVGIFTATRWEQEAVSRAILIEERARVGGVPCVIGRCGAFRVSVFRTGMGPVKASAVSREALASCSLDLAVSSGFACALTSSQIGDLLIGTDVSPWPAGICSVGLGVRVPCSVELQAAALESARRVGVVVQAGRFASVSHVLWAAEEKQQVAAGTGAVGLDMESAALGAMAKEQGIPFLVARTVSDLLDEDLPLDFNLFLTQKTWPQGLWQVARRPACLSGMLRLRRQSHVAAVQLTRFMEAFLNDIR
ncbi:MAG: hypothetical protein EPO61_05485 [Nitrospirae bacterium]|nr:MAG: hypothetical protein EPO61_05485 [Nitrospirota bacterium]